MKNVFHALLASTGLVALLIGMPSSVKGATITQIPGPFATTTYFGSIGGDSQFDAVTGPGDLQNFARVYDNFLYTTDMAITNFSWIGRYQFTPGSNIVTDDPNPGDTQPAVLANSFTVSIYGDNANAPGALLTSFGATSAAELAIGADLYSYSFNLAAPYVISGNTQYWFSVVANLNADTTGPLNVWGVAYSNIGDGLSFQDFQLNSGDPLTRFTDPIDFAFSVTAIPEPGTFLAISVISGAAGFCRYRKSRQQKDGLTTPSA